MSDMVTRYENSTSIRVTQAKNIPSQAVNFFDVTNEFQTEFTTGEKKGDPTKYTDKALNYYNTERTMVTLPDNFTPTENGITLNRWSPDNGYYTPGQPNG